MRTTAAILLLALALGVDARAAAPARGDEPSTSARVKIDDV